MTRLPYASVWENLLAHRRAGPVQAAAVIRRARQRYAVLQSEVPAAPTPGLRRQRDRLALPGLALYQALVAEGYAKPAALLECEALFQDGFFRGERRAIPLLNLLPDPYPLLRPALRQMCAASTLPGAGEVVEDSPRRFVFHTYHCYILDILAPYNAAGLARLFCLTDDWLAAGLPKVAWKRTQTLTGGGDHCDFWWENTREKNKSLRR